MAATDAALYAAEANPYVVRLRPVFLVPITGEASLAPAPATLAAAGDVAIAGAAAVASDAATAASSGTVAVTGGAELAPAAGAVSAAGTVAIAGGAALASAEASLAAAGEAAGAAAPPEPVTIGVTVARTLTAVVDVVARVIASCDAQPRVPAVATATSNVGVAASVAQLVTIRRTMATQTVLKGTRIRISAKFEQNGQVLDPAALKFTIKRPSRQAPDVYTYGVNGELVRASAGNFYVEVLVDWDGRAPYRWESTALNEESVQEGEIYSPPRKV